MLIVLPSASTGGGKGRGGGRGGQGKGDRAHQQTSHARKMFVQNGSLHVSTFHRCNTS